MKHRLVDSLVDYVLWEPIFHLFVEGSNFCIKNIDFLCHAELYRGLYGGSAERGALNENRGGAWSANSKI